ncbi:hypothetical protein KJ764_06020 [Patescibacteria group bacterium]|nr:hypothetical protein [Patescibacteria group bacterium]
MIEFLIHKTPMFFFKWFHRSIFGKRNMVVFEKFLKYSKWKYMFVRGEDVWVCQDDLIYNVIVEDATQEFKELWVEKFPDKNAHKVSIVLTVNGNPVEQVYFIYVDGFRFCVPMPEQQVINDKVHLFWDKNSIRFKVLEMFIKNDTSKTDRFSRYMEVAKRCDISITYI